LPTHRLKAAGTVFTYYCDAVAALSAASRTLDTQHFEFALDLAEYKIGSGHVGVTLDLRSESDQKLVELTCRAGWPDPLA
jgi:hypothetical protein